MHNTQSTSRCALAKLYLYPGKRKEVFTSQLHESNFSARYIRSRDGYFRMDEVLYCAYPWPVQCCLSNAKHRARRGEFFVKTLVIDFQGSDEKHDNYSISFSLQSCRNCVVSLVSVTNHHSKENNCSPRHLNTPFGTLNNSGVENLVRRLILSTA